MQKASNFLHLGNLKKFPIGIYIHIAQDQLQPEKINGVIENINIDATDLNFLPANLNESLEDLRRFKDFNSSVIPNMVT